MNRTDRLKRQSLNLTSIFRSTLGGIAMMLTVGGAITFASGLAMIFSEKEKYSTNEVLQYEKPDTFQCIHPARD